MNSSSSSVSNSGFCDSSSSSTVTTAVDSDWWIPARGRVAEFGNMQTSGAAILVHAVIYFGLITIFIIAIRVHIYAG
ncbi:hypothetical protein LINGRAHAP2_LOCUS26818 [Linum grandiflorum]